MCQICLEASTADDVEKMPKCSHTFCQECLHNYLLYRIKVGADLSCPLASCKEHISEDHSSFKQIPNGYRDRHRENQKFRQNHGESKSVLCQEKSCTGSVSFAEDKPKCSKCGEKYCKLCHLKSHDGNC